MSRRAPSTTSSRSSPPNTSRHRQRSPGIFSRFREGTELAPEATQEGPVPAPLSHPESAAHGRSACDSSEEFVAVRRADRVGSGGSPFAATAGGTGNQDQRRRPAPVAPPTAAPLDHRRQRRHRPSVRGMDTRARRRPATRCSGASPACGAPEPIATVGRSQFHNYQLVNGSLHTYKVAAFNKGGTGPVSAQASATPLAPPTGLTAVGGDRQITLTWAASLGATSYTVYRGYSWDHLEPVARSLAATRFVDTGLTNGKRYIYRRPRAGPQQREPPVRGRGRQAHAGRAHGCPRQPADLGRQRRTSS